MSKLYPCDDYQNIREIIEFMCNKWPDNNAFTLKEKNGKEVKYRDITFKEYKKDIEYFGTALMNFNIQNLRLAIIGPNSYPWAISFLATTTGAGVAVPLDKGLPEAEIESSIIRSKSNCLVFDSKHIEEIKNIISRGNVKIEKYICTEDIDVKGFVKETKLSKDKVCLFSKMLEEGQNLLEKKNNRKFVDAEIDNDAMCEIVFTSGTTSQSKMVMLSNRNVASNVAALDWSEKIYDNDTTICLIPFHHTFGSTGLLFMQSNGARAVFCDGLRYIQDNLIEYGVTTFIGVPLLIETMDKKVWQKVKKMNKTRLVKCAMAVSNFLRHIGIDIRQKLFKDIHENLGKLRFVVSGAAALDPKVAKDFDTWGFEVAQGYGLTETSPVLAGETRKEHKFGTVGPAMPNVELKIFEPDEDGIGELIAKGPNVMLGYYEDQEATDEVLIDGWFHTGDLAKIDDEGFVYITGRKKNVIVLKNGKNIFPEELESILNQKEYVIESLVFGYPDGDDLIVSVEIQYDKDYFENELNMTDEKAIEEYIWNDIKEFNQTVPQYKHIKKLFVTTETMIKTTTAKTKRKEEIAKILANK